ncbi:MAG: hypothetical protein WCP16_24600 [Pseudanabaena sp. ELA645]|jgi:hypothetical protein
MMVSTSFNQVLDLVEAMPDEEQIILFDLINRRRSERRRDEIAANIEIAAKEYEQGQVFRGSVDDVMAELMK